MADGYDLQDAPFAEPDDDAAEETDEVEPGAVEVVTETEVLIIAEEDFMVAWPDHPPGLGLTPVQLAVYAGWTMAVLYGTIASGPPNRPSALPTVNELAPTQRRKLEFARLRHLLSGLLPDFPHLAALSEVATGDAIEDTQSRSSKLQSLNLAILTTLTAKRPELQLAYELGRSLRDTANPPGGADAFEPQLDRGRIAKLQEWLLTLAPEFPPLTAAVVAGSLGRWSDLAAVTVGTEAVGESMCTYLLQQGDVWLMLLIGELATSGLLTPEGYVAASESALRRAGAIARGIIRHYWLGLLCVAVALFGTLFLALRYLEGAPKVWTSIACIAGGLGVSVQTIASTSSRLAAEAARPVFAIAEEDAMAWAITTMPPLPHLSVRGVRHLRRAGVAPSSSLGRF